MKLEFKVTDNKKRVYLIDDSFVRKYVTSAYVGEQKIKEQAFVQFNSPIRSQTSKQTNHYTYFSDEDLKKSLSTQIRLNPIQMDGMNCFDLVLDKINCVYIGSVSGEKNKVASDMQTIHSKTLTLGCSVSKDTDGNETWIVRKLIDILFPPSDASFRYQGMPFEKSK